MKVIVYDSIEKKNQLVEINPIELSSQEALIKTLDLMDFYARFGKTKHRKTDSTIPWIVLKMKKKSDDVAQ